MRAGWHGPVRDHRDGLRGRAPTRWPPPPGWSPSGRCDVAIGGGAEAALHPVAIAAFTNMTALSTSGISRPFDVRRDGFVMTEGAARPGARGLGPGRARGARIYAEIAGAASTADAHHITAPAPDGAGAVACMELALLDAGLEPADIAPHQRPRHLHPAQRPRRGPGHQQGLRRRRARW